MFLVLYDASWMTFNIVLALIPVLFGWILTRKLNKYLQVIFVSIWLVFLPNTIYLLTDIIHLFEDWERPIPILYKLIIAAMYIVLMMLGIFTFVMSLHPIERVFKKHMKYKTLIIIFVNFIIGFGMVLGRIERTNSWDVVTNAPKVFWDTLKIIMSPEKIVLFLIFGVLCNLIYFSFRKMVMEEVHDLESL